MPIDTPPAQIHAPVPAARGVVRPQDALPDAVNQAEINGVTVRKGTVAAFLQNAMRFTDPSLDATEHDALAHEIAEAAPALRALGVFTVFEARDERLRALLAAHSGT